MESTGESELKYRKTEEKVIIIYPLRLAREIWLEIVSFVGAPVYQYHLARTCKVLYKLINIEILEKYQRPDRPLKLPFILLIRYATCADSVRCCGSEVSRLSMFPDTRASSYMGFPIRHTSFDPYVDKRYTEPFRPGRKPLRCRTQQYLSKKYEAMVLPDYHFDITENGTWAVRWIEEKRDRVIFDNKENKRYTWKDIHRLPLTTLNNELYYHTRETMDILVGADDPLVAAMTPGNKLVFGDGLIFTPLSWNSKQPFELLPDFRTLPNLDLNFGAKAGAKIRALVMEWPDPEDDTEHYNRQGGWHADHTFGSIISSYIWVDLFVSLRDRKHNSRISPFSVTKKNTKEIVSVPVQRDENFKTFQPFTLRGTLRSLHSYAEYIANKGKMNPEMKPGLGRPTLSLIDTNAMMYVVYHNPHSGMLDAVLPLRHWTERHTPYIHSSILKLPYGIQGVPAMNYIQDVFTRDFRFYTHKHELFYYMNTDLTLIKEKGAELKETREESVMSL